MANAPMLDLHCHYLPGVDDGARTLADGIALVRASVANGIDRIVLTPHVHPGRYDNQKKSLKPRFEAFRRAVESAHIPVRLALASEARLCDELLSLLERDEVPLFKSAGGEQTLLLELPHNHIPAGSTAFIRWLLRRDIAPLIAHPERNKELMAHPQRLQQLREAGCKVQVTAAAIVGDFGARAQQTVNLFLDKGWVDLVASDAHNLRHRPPLMREARALLARRYGESIASELCLETPLALTAGNFAADVKARQPVVDSPQSLSDHPQAATDKHRPVIDKRQAAIAKHSGDEAEKWVAPPLQTDAAAVDPAVNVAAPPAEPSLSPEPPLLVNSVRRGGGAAPLAGKDVCDSALDRMRAKLLQHAAEPTGRGAKAARILELMNTLQAR